VSGAFSFYLRNFFDYNATYGSLCAVVGLMMWTWISVIILIFVAELNAEMNTRPPSTPRPESQADGNARRNGRRHSGGAVRRNRARQCPRPRANAPIA
jgi:membrane protein